MGFEIVRLPRDQRRSALVSVARAFHDDPFFNWFLPDLLRQARALVHFMRGPMADTRPFGEVWTALDGGTAKAVAAWLPPGAYPRSAWRGTRQLLLAAPAFLVTGRRIVAGLRLLAAAERAHPRYEHWYLSLLGVDPALQGRGVGTRLLAPVLARCDEEGLPAYVETQKESNVVWYGRSGFEVVRLIDGTGGCPPIWALERPPRV